METRHRLFFSDSGDMRQIPDESIDLIVTSPSYPMIEMWDSLYGERNPEIKRALLEEKGDRAFDLMHKELDKTWAESSRVLKKGGIACVNVGDATRTVGGRFQLYSNHSRIIQSFRALRLQTLPMILWHKKTNAPNKFMGSGMLPGNGYVTLEHEYILIFRKGAKRVFKTEKESKRRRHSAFFWEERNKWLSDIWHALPGARQSLHHDSLRRRSAAFPFELAHRLIHLYSAQGDTALDPFGGTGTTALAAMTAGRNSVSVEIDKSFREYIAARLLHSLPDLNEKIRRRLLDHIQFAEDYIRKKGSMKYRSLHYGFPVMTAQETSLRFPFVESIEPQGGDSFSVRHSRETRGEEKIERGGEEAGKALGEAPRAFA